MIQKHLFAFLLSVFSWGSLMAQYAQYSGKIQDSLQQAVTAANVLALQADTQIMDDFAISDYQGYFELKLEKNVDYIIQISYLGYKSINKRVNITKSKTVTFTMVADPQTLDEVELTYEMPVTIKGDTIVYSADAFSDGSERKLGDILENLPGVEVTDDGQIEVEGKEVSKVMVEGKDFFDGDSKLAQENIPADAVSKVEVLRNFTEVSQLRNVSDNEDNIALNIQLKEGKKNFWFGSINQGGGPEERYLLNPKIFYYSPKYSLNTIGSLNNMGISPLTPRDYFNLTGGFQGFQQGGGTSIRQAGDGLGLTNLTNNRAQQIATQFAAFNFSYSPIEALEFSGFVIASRSDIDLENAQLRQYNTSDVTENTQEIIDQESSNQAVKLSAAYHPDERLQLNYDLLFKSSKEDEFSDLQTRASVQDSILTRTGQTPNSWNQNLNAYYTLNDKHIFSLESRYVHSTQNPFYNTIRGQQPFGGLPVATTEDRFNIHQNKITNNRQFDITLDHYWLWDKKNNLRSSIGYKQSTQELNSGLFQRLDDGTLLAFEQTELNNAAWYRIQDIFGRVNYRFVKGIFTFDSGLTLHNYRVKDRQQGSLMEMELNRLVPNVQLMLKFRSSENLRLTYRMTNEFTDVSNIARGFVFQNYNSFFSGNRNIKNAVFHNYSINYFNYNMFNFTTLIGNLNYSKRLDAIKGDVQLRGINQVRSVQNSSFADEVYSGFGRFQKRFRKWKLDARIRLSYSELFNQINQQANRSTSLTQNYQASLSTNFKQAPNIELGYNLTNNRYDNGGVASQFFTERPFIRLDAVLGKNWLFNADYSAYRYRTPEQVLNEYAFLEATLSYRKKDSPWEYKLEATNLTNNQSINSDSFNAFYNTTSLYYVQPRYFLATLTYNL
ncbi:MAG: carboxypeptidase-like regulatory domain-containing protein [Flavobacteriaceae bacterium]